MLHEQALLAATATSRPKAALRAGRLDKKTPVQKVQLKQTQNMKSQLVKERFGCKTMGQLRQAVAKRQQLPADKKRGYFCYSNIITTPGQKPSFAIVATTRQLQERWVDTPSLVAAADGGFKFNFLGWPVHVIGHVNEAGQFGLCALGMTSTMQAEQVKSMFEGFRDSTVRVTQGQASKTWAMSDAEEAYRRAQAEVFGSSNLMCFFHVKQAAKDYMTAHFDGPKDACEKVWAPISADIDLLRGAFSEADFASRCAAVRVKWLREGLDIAHTTTCSSGICWGCCLNKGPDGGLRGSERGSGFSLGPPRGL